jgi:hypothetical protein
MTETTQDLLARLTEFTPGPWIVQTSEYGSYVVCDRGYPAVTDSRPNGYANLELAAAAPDLHRIATKQAAEIARLRDALENLTIGIGMGWDLESLGGIARDAIGD